MGKTKEKTPPSESVSTEIVAQEKTIVNFNAETLISQAISKNVPVETMEKLLAMRRELKAEWAKEQFTKAMAAFQSQCPTIQKTKEVHTKAGSLAYRYAPIESIVQQVAPYLQKNGFSYSANMELLENGTTKVKATIKVTHQDGHSELTEMTVPLGERTQIMSQTQVVAAAQTFAKRYAFCNAFGILTGDEDTDARPQEDMPREQTSDHQSAPTPARKATEKQAMLIARLCREKKINQFQVIEMAKGKSPSELIEALLKYQQPTHEQQAEQLKMEMEDPIAAELDF